MPIEIRELHIKAVIDSGGAKEGPQPAAGPKTDPAAGTDAEQLIELCVEKVLQILKEKGER